MSEENSQKPSEQPQQVPEWQPQRAESQQQEQSTARSRTHHKPKTAVVGHIPSNLDGDEVEFVDLTQKIYMRSVKGRFNNWRIALIWFTQVLFYGLPWINWDGRQSVLFDLIERKFYLFGLVLWPQDVFYLAIILIVSAYGLFLFTAIAGRLFCGYACPQTVYTQIFMYIEKWVEGDRAQRMRLDESPMSARKFRIKATKHILWVLVGFWTGFTFVAYFSPIRELFPNLLKLDLGFWEWFWIFLYGGFCWLAAGFLRENVCRYMCPYARFQSVMVDADTMIVTYDQKRGEPRGKRSKKANLEELGLGDCIDCTLCVQVCPTGIDIRHGLQYMCIGCGACIDACDDVMDKMNYPRGLIRYTSENSIAMGLTKKEERKRLFKPRTLVYLTLLIIFITSIVTSLALRNELRFDVVRDRNSLGREVPGGYYENVYRVLLVNMTSEPREFKIDAESPDLAKLDVNLENSGANTITVSPRTNQWIPVVVRTPVEGSEVGRYDMDFHVRSIDEGKQLKIDKSSSFFVPE